MLALSGANVQWTDSGGALSPPSYNATSCRLVLAPTGARRVMIMKKFLLFRWGAGSEPTWEGFCWARGAREALKTFRGCSPGRVTAEDEGGHVTVGYVHEDGSLEL